MIAKPLVAIITPTIGTKYLEQNLDSVSKQTYKNIKHLIVADGPDYADKVKSKVSKFKKSNGERIKKTLRV